LESQLAERVDCLVEESAVSFPQHPDKHRPERPILLAVDQELGEGPALRIAPELADPLGAVEIVWLCRSRSWPVSVKDPGLGIDSCQVKDSSYRPRRIHQHNRVATLGRSPDKEMDGARIQEGQLSQVQDDGLSRNHDPVDLVLKFLNGGHVELASK
jgi:hypothetical protein